jgi:hypothetical protein
VVALAPAAECPWRPFEVGGGEPRTAGTTRAINVP